MHVRALRELFMNYITCDLQAVAREDGRKQEERNISYFRYVYGCLMSSDLQNEPITVLKCDRSSDMLCKIIFVVSALSIRFFYQFFIRLILHICIFLSVAFFHNLLVFMKFIILSKNFVCMNWVKSFMGFFKS